MRFRDYLIASESNDYKPWIITPTALAVFCLVIWSLRIIVPSSFTIAAPGIDAYDLMNRINEERTQRFIPALTTENRLISAASGKARDMLDRSYFSHVDPDGKYVWPRIASVGYSPYLTLGENLAMDFTSAGDVVAAWMNSPTHRANIVNSKFEDQGMASIFGAYEPGHDAIVIVNLFGTLVKSSTPSPAPNPPTAAPAPVPQPTPQPPIAVTPPVVQAPAPIASSKEVKISKDINISTTSLSGKLLVEVNTIISGSPTLVTANLNGHSITLLPGNSDGEFAGVFTFGNTNDYSEQILSIEARAQNGNKTTLDHTVTFPEFEENTSITGAGTIPVSEESKVFSILRIIFGILACIYLIFLIIDAIIIHRAKINRDGVNPNPHLLIFILIVSVSFFINWM